MANKTKNQIFTSANIVTIIRICFVPIFVIAFLSPWPSFFPDVAWLEAAKPWIALGIFVLLAATDSLDGYLARSRGEVTDFGKFLDPLADKILVAAALIALVELGNLPSWVVLVILMREFIVSGLRMLAASKGLVVAASWYGKAKTVFQIIAIILFILKNALAEYGTQNPSHPLYIISWIVMIIAVILTIVSMIDYIIKCKDVLGFGDSQDEVECEISPNSLQNEAEDLVGIATNHRVTIGCCESLTCGMIASSIGSVSGASAVFSGGLATYTYSAKSRILGIDLDFLNKNGAVNYDTAIQMAANSAKKLAADYTVSTTGVAGPDKDDAGNEVGTVFIAVTSYGNTVCKKYMFNGSRQEIRMQAASAAMNQLKESISKRH